MNYENLLFNNTAFYVSGSVDLSKNKVYMSESTVTGKNTVEGFFESIGYTVEYDSSKYSEFWYNIYDENNKMVFQVDQGVPLADIIEDLCQLYLGKEPSSKTQYKVWYKDNDAFKTFVKSVYNVTKLKILPNGQTEFNFV